MHGCVYAARPTAHHPVTGSSARQAVISHNIQSVLQPPLSSPVHMTLSTSCPQHLDSRHLDQSLDSLQLTQMEIDAIRDMGRGSRASSPSTPTSQLSHPDFVDPRPDIYRFVYDISPGSRSRASDNASVTAEAGDIRSSELEPDSKFDEIVISSMEHTANRHVAQQHKAKTVTICESEDTAGRIESESLPTSAQSASSIHDAASEHETRVTVTSMPAAVQSSDVMVVSVGDALVAVEPGNELLASEGSSEMQRQSLSTTVFHRESTSSRIHKGSLHFCYENFDHVSLF